jgi:hypothetical protein
VMEAAAEHQGARKHGKSQNGAHGQNPPKRDFRCFTPPPLRKGLMGVLLKPALSIRVPASNRPKEGLPWAMLCPFGGARLKREAKETAAARSLPTIHPSSLARPLLKKNEQRAPMIHPSNIREALTAPGWQGFSFA